MGAVSPHTPAGCWRHRCIRWMPSPKDTWYFGFRLQRCGRAVGCPAVKRACSQPMAVVLALRCASPRSRHRLSMARRAFSRMVPPGVSYTPRDFMPTNLQAAGSMLGGQLGTSGLARRDARRSRRKEAQLACPPPGRAPSKQVVRCRRPHCRTALPSLAAIQHCFPRCHTALPSSLPHCAVLPCSPALHNVHAPNAVLAAQAVELGEQGGGGHAHAIDGHRVTLESRGPKHEAQGLSE